MVILTLDVPNEWVLWSDISYWCCAMTASSMYFHQTNKRTLKDWFTFMDEEYRLIFDFAYLLSHPDWYKGKETSLEKQGVIGKIPLSFVKKVRHFRAKEDKSINEIRSDNWHNRKKSYQKDESKIKKKKRQAKKIAKATYTELKHIYQNTVRNYGLSIQIQSYFLYYQHFSTYYS